MFMKAINKYHIYIKLSYLFILFFSGVAFTQPVLPQRTITIFASQPIDFGLFYDSNGSGGTISLNPEGIRTVTGGIKTLPSFPGRPALFEIKLCQGRTVTINYPTETILIGTNKAEIKMKIGPTNKGENGVIFATENNCNFITILRVGGTLTIPPNTKKGVFSGDFEISFDQQ